MNGIKKNKKNKKNNNNKNHHVSITHNEKE